MIGSDFTAKYRLVLHTGRYFLFMQLNRETIVYPSRLIYNTVDNEKKTKIGEKS